jgi:hypothetical protein
MVQTLLTQLAAALLKLHFVLHTPQLLTSFERFVPHVPPVEQVASGAVQLSKPQMPPLQTRLLPPVVGHTRALAQVPPQCSTS